MKKIKFRSARPQLNLKKGRIRFDLPFTHDLFGNKIALQDADISTTKEELNNNENPHVSYEYEETNEEAYQDNLSPMEDTTRSKKGFRGLALPLEL